MRYRLARFFGLKHEGATKPKDRASKSAAGQFNPSVSRSLSDVTLELKAAGARCLGVHGDAAFRSSLRHEMPDANILWISSDFRDVEAGAQIADQADLSGLDAIVCGGSEVAVRWRHILHLLARRQRQEGNGPAERRSLPVHWVGERWEFCGGMLPVPAQAADAEALLFNHFEQFFGIREALQFHVTLYHGTEAKDFYKILEPNESILIRLSDFFPEREHTAAFSVSVEHPILTRGRHYRLRLCGDVFWRGSLTTLHSAHEFNRDPQRTEEFRLSSGLLRHGDMVVTIPNYDRNQITGSTIKTHDGIDDASKPRDLTAYLQEVRITTPAEAGRLYSFRYQGYGGSFWFALDEDVRATEGKSHKGSIAGNHHVSVPWKDRPGMELQAAERVRIEQLIDAGYMIEPHAVPITGLDEHLDFGFDCDSANPPSDHFLVYLFDSNGKHLTTHAYRKMHWGPSFSKHFLAGVDPATARTARLAMIAPDWLRNGYTRKRYKLQADLVVEDRRTGDRDITEFQSSWRNLGVAIQDFPHWLAPANSVICRSNLVARVRYGDGFRTGLIIVNGSGSLQYRNSARVHIIVTNLAGLHAEHCLDIAPLTWRILWINDLIPNLSTLLEGSVGALQIKSSDADLNCQLLTTTDWGAVSLQHLWGY